MANVYTGGSGGKGFGGSSGGGWGASNPADLWRAQQNPLRDPFGQPKPGSQAWYQQQNNALGGVKSPVWTGNKKPSGGGVTGSYSGGGGYGSGGGWEVPSFQMPEIDRAYFEALGQKQLQGQLDALNALRSQQEAQATSAQKSARGDYFDQYRDAQYNRAGRGMGGSPLGQGEERQVQLAMSDTIGDIMNTLSGNLNQIGAQEAQAIANKDLLVEQMYQQQQAIAFDQSMQKWNADMQKLGMEYDMAQRGAYGSGNSALEQLKAQMAQQGDTADLDGQIAMVQIAIDSATSDKEKNRLGAELAKLQNQRYASLGGTNFQPFTYTPIVAPAPKLSWFDKLGAMPKTTGYKRTLGNL